MLQSRAVSMDRIDSRKRRDAAEQSSSWKRKDDAEQSSSWIVQISGKDGMLQSRAVPGQSRFLEKTGCSRVEQFLDSLDSQKIRDAAEKSSSWIVQISGKDGMLQSRAVPRQSIFLEKTGCCRAEQFLDRKIPGKDRMLQSRAVPGQTDSWQRQDAPEQSSSWIVQISGKDGMLQSRAVPGQSRFLEKTGCCGAEQFLDSLDFWKRRDAADQSSSGIEWIPGKDGMLQIRAVPGQNRFLEKTGLLQSRKGRGAE